MCLGACYLSRNVQVHMDMISFVNQSKAIVCALFIIVPCKGVTNLIFMLLEDL